jgi:hypothetical protein
MMKAPTLLPTSAVKLTDDGLLGLRVVLMNLRPRLAQATMVPKRAIAGCARRSSPKAMVFKASTERSAPPKSDHSGAGQLALRACRSFCLCPRARFCRASPLQDVASDNDPRAAPPWTTPSLPG